MCIGDKVLSESDKRRIVPGKWYDADHRPRLNPSQQAVSAADPMGAVPQMAAAISSAMQRRGNGRAVLPVGAGPCIAHETAPEAQDGLPSRRFR
ncbi:hypothetical protein METH_04500 [Leisingera methylohalidivorans DSM 14336]|uniref:Uncharacterized protein n=1 Tax=Leisingera methylohalidivorans DSM 14336 TaxID=999552 RepID=V9VY69_9RHOB|nr:hypothetical protein METH_04500 [Leisingera methylohalidivorans DSM 14336]